MTTLKLYAASHMTAELAEPRTMHHKCLQNPYLTRNLGIRLVFGGTHVPVSTVYQVTWLIIVSNMTQITDEQIKLKQADNYSIAGNFGEVLIWRFGELGKDYQIKNAPI